MPSSTHHPTSSCSPPPHTTHHSFAKHYDTKEALPEEQYQRLRAARTFRAATMMLRQVNGRL